MDDIQRRTIMQECSQLEPVHDSSISSDLMDVLKLVFKFKAQGLKASYTLIENELGITRPTLRRRMNTLINLCYLKEVQTGREKVTDLTDKGINLLSR